MAVFLSRLTKSRSWLAVASLAALGLLVLWSKCPPSVFFASACSRATPLVELFPDLARLQDTTALTITAGWEGLADISSASAQYVLELRGDQFEGTGRGTAERQSSHGTASVARETAVPRDIIRAFLAAGKQVALTEQEYEPRMTHTDDYPYVRVEVQSEGRFLRIETRSQPYSLPEGKYLGWSPWAVEYAGRTFVTAANDLDKS
jgi:hypothetical protein